MQNQIIVLTDDRMNKIKHDTCRVGVGAQVAIQQRFAPLWTAQANRLELVSHAMLLCVWVTRMVD